MAALTPAHGLPGLAGQRLGEVADLDRPGLAVASQQPASSTSATPRLRWQRRGSGRPDRCRALHTDNVGQAQLGDPTAESRVVAVAGIGKHDSLRHAILDSLPDLVE